MKAHFGPKYASRGVLVTAIALGVYAASGCGSNSSVSSSANPNPDAGLATGGISGGFDTGGTTGSGGAPGSSGGAFGNSGTGGLTFITTGGGPNGDGGPERDGGLNGDASVANGGASSGGASSGSGGGRADGGPTCLPATNFLDVSSVPDCDQTAFPLCTNGKCIPNTAVPASELASLADCAPDKKCVPTFFVETDGRFIPKTCTSLNGEEGRCLSECLPQVSSQATILPKDVCGAGDLCAPCYDPRTGADTGACSLGCDTGPTQPPKPYKECCTGQGSCVPSSIVPANQVSLLGKDVCTGATDVCAPDKLSDSTYVPKTCQSISGAEGRCLANCLPDVAAQASRLPQDTCDSGELCAPCYDPITGKETAACTINGDKPANPPFQFAGCCSGLGHCLPTTLLTSAQQAAVGKDTCTGAGDLCAPDVFSVAGELPATCRALGTFSAEGRCVPTCVPSIQAQENELDQGSPACPANTLCAPCYDPETGADTGACTENGDAPKEAKKLFATCCGGAGDCVPKTVVPPADLSQLGPDVCTGTGMLCAPKAFLDPTAQPAKCVAPGNLEARCLPSCLPAIQAEQANLLQGTCATNELCAPCYNPLDGSDTGACEVNGDEPTQAKTVYPGCCPYPATNGTNRGTCVPSVLVPTTEASILPQDSCSANYLCAPNLKAKDQTAKFPSCSAGLGACLPDCLITNAAEKALLNGIGCQAGELCAPCSLLGATTHACD